MYYRWFLDSKVAPGFPQLVAANNWQVPTPVNAALTYPLNRRTYFFVGAEYYAFDNSRRRVTIETVVLCNVHMYLVGLYMYMYM